MPIDKLVTREQRGKTGGRDGAPFGTLTLQLSYNRDILNPNDLCTVKSLKRLEDGSFGPTGNQPRMEMQTKRPPMHKEGEFEKTPGLEKLGLSQSTWGTDDGWAGGTEEVLTTKRTPFVRMNHIKWEQQKKSGYGSYSDPNLDVMYYPKDSLLHPRPVCVTDIAHQRDREEIVS